MIIILTVVTCDLSLLSHNKYSLSCTYLILAYLDVLNFRRDKPPLRVLSLTNTFDDYKCDNYIDSDYEDF